MLRAASFRSQSGVSLIGLLIWAIVVAFVALIGIVIGTFVFAAVGFGLVTWVALEGGDVAVLDVGDVAGREPLCLEHLAAGAARQVVVHDDQVRLEDATRPEAHVQVPVARLLARWRRRRRCGRRRAR